MLDQLSSWRVRIPSITVSFTNTPVASMNEHLCALVPRDFLCAPHGLLLCGVDRGRLLSSRWFYRPSLLMRYDVLITLRHTVLLRELICNLNRVT